MGRPRGARIPLGGQTFAVLGRALRIRRNALSRRGTVLPSRVFIDPVSYFCRRATLFSRVTFFSRASLFRASLSRASSSRDILFRAFLFRAFLFRAFLFRGAVAL